jgi:type II secretion system protein C
MRPMPFGHVPVVLLAAACACGGSGPALTPAAGPPPQSAAAAAPSKDGHVLARSAVHSAIVDGLGVFFQRVDLDDQPVMSGGKFHGFRIAGFRDATFWSGVDLKPGDVVTSVNGMPIERPEQAQTALESLDAAKELRVAFERDGQPHELVYAIVDGR